MIYVYVLDQFSSISTLYCNCELHNGKLLFVLGLFLISRSLLVQLFVYVSPANIESWEVHQQSFI